MDFIVSLGDIVQGYETSQYEQSLTDFREVMKCFEGVQSVRHVLGNHCRSLTMEILMKGLHLQNPYYSFLPAQGWRVVVLNSAELCQEAVDTSKNDTSTLQKLVSDRGRPTHHYHGAIGPEQMAWFQNQIEDARVKQERVIVLSHYPLADGAARSTHVLANTDDVRAICESYNTPVVLCIAGHDHLGTCCTHARCENMNIHFLL